MHAFSSDFRRKVEQAYEAGRGPQRQVARLFRTVRQNLKTKVEEPVIARSRRRRSNLASAEITGPRLLRCARNDPLPLRPVLEFCPIVLSVNLSFVQELLQRYRQTGSGAPKPHGGGNPGKVCGHLVESERLHAQKPDASLAARCEQLAAVA